MPRRDPAQPPKPRGRPRGSSRVVALVSAPFRIHPGDLARWLEWVAWVRRAHPDASFADCFGELLEVATGVMRSPLPPPQPPAAVPPPSTTTR